MTRIRLILSSGSGLVFDRLAPVESEKEYEEGIIIKVLGIEVYNNVE